MSTYIYNLFLVYKFSSIDLDACHLFCPTFGVSTLVHFFSVTYIMRKPLDVFKIKGLLYGEEVIF